MKTWPALPDALAAIEDRPPGGEQRRRARAGRAAARAGSAPSPAISRSSAAEHDVHPPRARRPRSAITETCSATRARAAQSDVCHPAPAAPSIRSTSSCGSRRTRSPWPVFLTSSSARGSVSGRSRLERISASSTPPEPPAVGRVDGSSERDRLAVHRPPGRDDQVGEGDQALCLHGVIGNDQGRQGELLDVGPLLLGAGQHDRMDTGVRAYSREYLREERIRAAVIERDVGRRANHHHDPLRVDAQLLERVRVRPRSRRGSTPP